MANLSLPLLPCKHDEYVSYLAKQPSVPLAELTIPFKDYENKLREVFAQSRDHEAIQDPLVNAVPVYSGHEDSIRHRARSTDNETENSKYVMPVKDENRRKTGEPAIVPSLSQFKKNFSVFSESSLVDLDWSNVVAAGSAVVTSLLPVPDEHNESKRALREYYHKKIAPSSDVDLFIWGLDEAAAIEKIKQIETRIRDAILTETVTVRTKNAITIVSQYPTRHVQIVLRLYKSVSEILTGFDVDSSCFAYDGSQVYGTPRGITAFMSQCNTVDLSRRSPSYESRLAKYAHRGFEIHVPFLERDRIDPTVFERSFPKTMGLARLLVLERLPKVSDRDAYMQMRRQERGRPPAKTNSRSRGDDSNNLKTWDLEDVAEWVWEADVSNYHTFTIPYGSTITHKKVERILYSTDYVMNAEWATEGNRDVNLHRHPCFIGNAASVVLDCCQACPVPTTDEEIALAEEESKIYVSGELKFMKDDPGRQAIGSFNPITTDDWLEMAYLDILRLFAMQSHKDENDVNERDHTGRTPLHLATQSSTPEVVKCLVDSGARIVARVADGMTALHMAANRGQAEMVTILLDKSEANEAAEEEKQAKLAAKKKSKNNFEVQDAEMKDVAGKDEDEMDVDEDSADYEGSDDNDAMTQGSFVKVEKQPTKEEEEENLDGEELGPDVYDVNVLSWDSSASPLHLAILGGHLDIIGILIDRYGADPLIPMVSNGRHNHGRYHVAYDTAILTLAMATLSTTSRAEEVVKALLEHGTSSAQADSRQISALHYITVMREVEILRTLFEHDGPSAKAAATHMTATGWWKRTHTTVTGWWKRPYIHAPLLTAIRSRDETVVRALLENSVEVEIPITSFARFANEDNLHKPSVWEIERAWKTEVDQPVIEAVDHDMPKIVRELMERGVSVNSLTKEGQQKLSPQKPSPSSGYNSTNVNGKTLLDYVEGKIKALKSTLRPRRTCAPIELEQDSHYLGDFQPGSYRYWHVNKQLDIAKEIVRSWYDDKKVRDENKPQSWHEQKRHTISVLKDFISLQEYLKENGAKRFDELHPDTRDSSDESEQPPNKVARVHKDRNRNEWKFELNFSFSVLDLDDEKRDEYLELFEAAWMGDVSTVKVLAINGRANSKPLRVAIKDQVGFSPFSIALARGHKDLAQMFLEIAQAQYDPKHHKQDEKPRRRYRVSTSGNNYGSQDGYSSENDYGPEDGFAASDDGSGVEVRIHSELIDEKHTIDNIAALQVEVGSTVTAQELFGWTAPYWMLYEKTKIQDSGHLRKVTNADLDFSSEVAFQRAWQSSTDVRENLFNTLISQGDLDGVKMVMHHAKESRRTYETQKPLAFVWSGHVSSAIRYGHFQVASEIARFTGVGLPLDMLAQESGMRLPAEKAYYQGLLINGRHKSEWALAAGGGISYTGNADGSRPPILEMAYTGKLEALEWVLGGTPRRLFHEFGEANKDDKRVATLALGEGGFPRAVDKWLQKRSQLAIHCAILSFNNRHFAKSDDERLASIKRLIEVMPNALEAKSAAGLTPLSLAFSEFRPAVAKLLINSGADQSVRDEEGRNLVHLALRGWKSRWGVTRTASGLKQLLDLIDRRLLPDMMMERASSGPTGLTPLAWWISEGDLRISENEDENSPAVLRTLMEYLSGDEVSALDGSGQLVTHHLLKRGASQVDFELLQILLEKHPELVMHENVSGQTATELAESLRVLSLSSRFGTYTTRLVASRPYISPRHQGLVPMPPADDTREPIDSIVKLCKATEKLAGGKRKLVSVLQATEVSNRIANLMQKKGRREGRIQDVRNADEVGYWTLG